MKKAVSLLMILCLLLGSGPGALAAEEPKPEVTFEAEAPEANGTFTVTFSVSNLKFRVFQFSLNFDPKEMVLADSSGKATEQPESYQENLSDGGVNEIGCEADNEKGFLGFTGFVLPGQTDKRIDQNGCMAAGDPGIELFRFRFKRLGTIKTGLTVSSEQSTGIANAEGDVSFGIKFFLPDSFHEELTPEQMKTLQEGDESAPSDQPEALSRKERLKGTVALQMGNSAAVVEGVRKDIYSGENVTPYEERGVTYFPLRFVAEQLGAQVTWQGKTRTVSLKRGTVKAEIAIGSKEYTLNGKKRSAAQAAVLKNSRTMVPSEMLEALCDVKMTDTGGLLIFTPAGAPWNPSGTVETSLAADMSLLLSPLVGMFTKK